MIISPLRVYIIASWKGDLEDERKTVEELVRLDLFMAPIYPREASIRDVSSDYFKRMNECDFVIVILGSVYSKHVFNEINYAFNNDKPVLCFVKDCEKDENLQKEIDRLKDNRIVIKLFETSENLEREVKEAIISLLSDKFKDFMEIEKSILKLIDDGRIEMIKPKPLQDKYIDVPRINPYDKR